MKMTWFKKLLEALKKLFKRREATPAPTTPEKPPVGSPVQPQPPVEVVKPPVSTPPAKENPWKQYAGMRMGDLFLRIGRGLTLEEQAEAIAAGVIPLEVAPRENWNNSGPLTGTHITGSGHNYVNTLPDDQFTQFTFTVSRPGQVELVYGVTTGSNAGASVTSYLEDQKGKIVLPTDTRVLANSQNFPVTLEPGNYVWNVKPSQIMPLLVVIYGI